MPSIGMSSVYKESDLPTAESFELRENNRHDGHRDVKRPDDDKLGVDDVLNKIGCGLFQVLAYLLAASSRNLTFAFVPSPSQLELSVFFRVRSQPSHSEVSRGLARKRC